jgi:hypothetical protein
MELSVYCKNTDDLLAIIEQIAVYFNPSVTVRLTLSEELGIEKDVAIDFDGQIPFNDNSEEGFGEVRIITADMNFIMKGWLYGPVKEQKVILTSIVDVDSFLDEHYQTYTAVAPIDEPFVKERGIVSIIE